MEFWDPSLLLLCRMTRIGQLCIHSSGWHYELRNSKLRCLECHPEFPPELWSQGVISLCHPDDLARMVFYCPQNDQNELHDEVQKGNFACSPRGHCRPCNSGVQRLKKTTTPSKPYRVQNEYRHIFNTISQSVINAFITKQIVRKIAQQQIPLK